jgi:hypothetical protein
MSEYEVIDRLKQHLLAVRMNKGIITQKDLWWCVRYIRDFLLFKKNKAVYFLEEKVLECSQEQYLKKWGVS